MLSFVKTIEFKKAKPEASSGVQTKYVYSCYILVNLLTIISFCYLLLPVIIFIYGFVRTEISLAITGLVCYACYRFFRDALLPADHKIKDRDLLQEWHAWRGHLALMSALALIWLSFSSIGGIGYRNFDSGIRSSLLWHLVTGSWPLYFRSGYFGSEFGALSDKAYVYYFAYYLPAAVVGKLLGWKAANLALFAYSWVGTVLALMLVRTYVQGRGYVVTLMVFMGISLFGGMDYVWNSLFRFTADRSEMWLSPLHYFSHTRNLFWSPHHCLPTWLIIGIILNRRQINPLIMRIFPLAVVSMLLWSPLCLIGLLPFLFAMAKHYWKDWLELSLINTSACFICILLAAFIVSNDFSFRMFYAPNVIDRYWIQYSIFVLVEFGIVSSIFVLSNNKILKHGTVLLLFTLLLIIPIFILGRWNDWCIKLSMPPLFVLSVFMIKQIIWLVGNNKRGAFFSVLIFGAGALTPIEELVYSAKNYRISFETPPEIRDFGPNYIVWQQLGDPDKFFFRYLARR